MGRALRSIEVLRVEDGKPTGWWRYDSTKGSELRVLNSNRPLYSPCFSLMLKSSRVCSERRAHCPLKMKSSSFCMAA